MTHFHRLWLLGTLLGCLGCASLKSAFGGGVDLQAKGLSTEAPSNVSVYLVAQVSDQPLSTLDESAFRIYEDASCWTPPKAGPPCSTGPWWRSNRTLLLLDLSGALSEGGEREAVARAAAAFVARVTELEAVTVYGFAGEAQPALIGEYPRGQPGTRMTWNPSSKPSSCVIRRVIWAAPCWRASSSSTRA